jgi:hypothetical protein
MIEAYLRRLDAVLAASALVHDVEIIRRSIRDTEFEKVLHYRSRVLLANGDFIEMTERLLETQGRLEDTKYRHHWQYRNALLLKRWDNAPHHRSVDTFPHHLHDGGEDHVVRHPATMGLEVLQQILEEGEVREQGQRQISRRATEIGILWRRTEYRMMSGL